MDRRWPTLPIAVLTLCGLRSSVRHAVFFCHSLSAHGRSTPLQGSVLMCMSACICLSRRGPLEMKTQDVDIAMHACGTCAARPLTYAWRRCAQLLLSTPLRTRGLLPPRNAQVHTSGLHVALCTSKYGTQPWHMRAKRVDAQLEEAHDRARCTYRMHEWRSRAADRCQRGEVSLPVQHRQLAVLVSRGGLRK